MINVLRNPTYARLFSAQVIALLGTGLLTVALGLLAFDLAGDSAGAVLGSAYAIKMVAYVGLAPIANALVVRLPRKAVLIAADIIRALIALLLPFIDAVWQIFVLIFLLQAASATFTPTFQATIPDILEDEADYTKALSLSRLAYDLENLISPVLAGLLLLVISYHWLFMGAVVGFAASAMLVLFAVLPAQNAKVAPGPFLDRLTRGTRIYLATPRLRGLLALTLTAASASAFVLVNTVVMVRSGYDGDEKSVAYALAAYGAGSMLAALAMPRLLGKLTEQVVMKSAAIMLSGLTLGFGAYLLIFGLPFWPVFLLIWAITGFLYASILTPSGRLLRNSAHAEDRPSVFAAQFALSHVCWLITYPVAGWAGKVLGLPGAMTILGLLAFVGVAISRNVWPADDPKELLHDHPELPRDHPHFRDHKGTGRTHRHVFVIDDEHRAWPTHG